MKRTLLVITVFLFTVSFSNAQGLVSEGNNYLIGRNSGLSLAPLYLGLGTSTPSAMLHTNGTLRFEGLANALNNRILATDINGNVAWRDASTLNDANAWNINGNSNISAGDLVTPANNIHFLGTTNNQAIDFRVNNQKRFSISRAMQPGGFTRNVTQIEAGVSNDNTNLANLYVWSRDVVGLSIPFFISSKISNPIQGNPNALMAFSAQPGDNNTLGRLIRLNQGSTAADGGQDFYDIGIDNFQDLYFTGHQRPGSLTAPPLKVITISCNITGQNPPVVNTNRVGINIAWGNQPTADFHTVGTVRHQDLPNNPGTPVVIDAQGNIYRSSGRSSLQIETDLDNLQNRVSDLENLAASLQEQLNDCCRRKERAVNPNPTVMDGEKDNIVIYQNTPNPFTSATHIKYYIPARINKASLRIYDLSGKEIKSISVSAKSLAVDIAAGQLTAGMYIALIVGDDGSTSQSIKMILTK